MFIELDESIGGNIILGNIKKILIKEKYKVLIQLENGKHELSSNVHYVTTINNNISCLEQLLEKG